MSRRDFSPEGLWVLDGNSGGGVSRRDFSPEGLWVLDGNSGGGVSRRDVPTKKARSALHASGNSGGGVSRQDIEGLHRAVCGVIVQGPRRPVEKARSALRGIVEAAGVARTLKDYTAQFAV